MYFPFLHGQLLRTDRKGEISVTIKGCVYELLLYLKRVNRITDLKKVKNAKRRVQDRFI